MQWINGFALLDTPLIRAYGRAPSVKEACALALTRRRIVPAKKDDYQFNEVLTGKDAEAAAEPTAELADDNVSASHDENTYSEAVNTTPTSELLPSADDDERAKAYKCPECGSALDVYRGSENEHKVGTGFCPKCHERKLLQK